ncbi:MAG: hypothetical protein ABSB12_00960 [Candidatus Saccharimonadales bacterium]|jgi:hypothetical protein
MTPTPVISVKEARKLLGKSYRTFSDSEVEQIVVLLNVVATEAVQSKSSKITKI